MDVVSAVPLIAGLLIFLASLISLRLGFSIAIIEILLGFIAGNFLSFSPEPWMVYLASFGGIVLTFLAGAEVDLPLLKSKFKESLLIGGLSFVLPLVAGFAFSYYALGWQLYSSLIAGIALSANSIAVVYSVLVETGLNKTAVGKIIMASTFVTNIGTALTLSIVFLKPDFFTLEFAGVSLAIILLAAKYSDKLFSNKLYKNKVAESEIKYIFLLLLALSYFASVAQSQAILPAFLLGLLMSPRISGTFDITYNVKIRLRTVAYALITPFFFLLAGLRASIQLIISSFWAFASLFAIKQATKFIGAYLPSKKYLPKSDMYISLLMSTGL
ncbi:MAG TPA: cation:proton antiporter, partial [Candidatus Micrarchaeota archaeon]|nr:cation:proton antiporter [Candidatus Micrarchaeota archaeon]